MTWRVVNVSASPVIIADAWVPHGRFRGEGHIRQNLQIGPGDESVLELVVKAREEPGTLVENAYLILRTRECRVFARMRIEFDTTNAPRPIVEAVTAQSLE
jgi:hypothetical protein